MKKQNLLPQGMTGTTRRAFLQRAAGTGLVTVAGIAREMGITRQSVQRVADILAERGLARYLPNPAHRRAKLLTPTEQGRDAIARIGPGHAAAAGQLVKTLGEQSLADAVAALRSLSEALEEAWLA